MQLVRRLIVASLGVVLHGLWYARAPRGPLPAFAHAYGTAKVGGDYGELRMSTYDRLFAPLRAKPITLIEIGVLRGESLRMWRSYFTRARVIGVDVNEEVRRLRIPGVEIFIGDQSDPRFLEELVGATSRLDIVIDDGGHRAEQQVTTLLHLWPHLAPGGIYAIEDTETSYMAKYGMSWRAEGTTMEVLKGIADDLHDRWHDHGVTLKSVASLCFQPSLCVIRKAAPPPTPSRRERIRRAAIGYALARVARATTRT